MESLKERSMDLQMVQLSVNSMVKQKAWPMEKRSAMLMDYYLELP